MNTRGFEVMLLRFCATAGRHEGLAEVVVGEEVSLGDRDRM